MRSKTFSFNFQLIKIIIILFLFIYTTIYCKKNILYQSDFKNLKKWIFRSGKWSLSSRGLIQSDLNEWNTSASFLIEQTQPLTYEWRVKMTDGILDAGIHIFASSSKLSERGISYLIWQYKNGFVIYKTLKNRIREIIRFPVKTLKDTVYLCKVKYNPLKGQITIFRDHDFIGSYKDLDPIKKGNYISLRTNKTRAVFLSIKVY